MTSDWDGVDFDVLGYPNAPHWDVYKGGANGFANSATTWTVPSGGWTGQGFVRLSGNASDAGDQDWTTTDLDGDGQLDLVVTSDWDGVDFDVLGYPNAPHWDVYKGGANGFANNATTWTVPSGGWTGQGFVRLSGNASDAGDQDWTTTDLDGDGFVDLVVTADWDGVSFEVLGYPNAPHWDVYRGSEDGFEAAAVSWPIPAGGWTGQGFVRLYGSASDAGDQDWTTTDLNGDGYPDLVVTADWDGMSFEVLGYPNMPHWRAYFGTP
ncbi:FG-GAP repeat protein [Enhygromyxa salina]|uniref:FG-GAP repeat protein n=1 Tax=Enhygromyxa salina TaxID=215803 RepID=A0A2S9YP34_9BACT|nr:FG-GAP repeat protein [Enhygromyxa salina]